MRAPKVFRLAADDCQSITSGWVFLVFGVGNFGDWADVLVGLTPVWLWRSGLTVLGAVSYVLVVWLALLELRPFLAGPVLDRGRSR
jgi:hypothetical protein